MENTLARHIAVIGAGLAGTACAQALTQAGHAVHVFDKSRGAGGRLATRRMSWVDDLGQTRTTRVDHGALAVTASSKAFQAFATQALLAGHLAEWRPIRAAHGASADDHLGPLYVPRPDMPALCRHLLQGSTTTWSFAVDRLQKTAQGWLLSAKQTPHRETFDAVLLALPPAQAAPLLSPHRPDWARHAAVAPMQPCWTLMGVAAAPRAPLGWDLATPTTGPLASVLRSDSRPGREQVPGHAHWVAHARAGWSRRHLEQPPEWVMQQLQAALAEILGEAQIWQVCAVHRWRYALPQCPMAAPAASSWWDAAQGLGVCGDFLGGAAAEGAWLSAQHLTAALLQRGSGQFDPSDSGQQRLAA